MHNASNCQWDNSDNNRQKAFFGESWRNKVRAWRAKSRQKRVGYLRARLIRKLELNESQAEELERFLERLESFRRVYHEERDNAVGNVLQALEVEQSDWTRVEQGTDSAVERLHLQLDKVMEDFSVWVATLEYGQRQQLSRIIARRFHYPKY